MQRVYRAANNVEAHMVVHMLEQSGVRAHVQGEHLQSGAGELPLGNLVAVAVADEDVASARELIREWEAQIAAPDEPTAATSRQSSGVSHGMAFVAGVALTGVLAWSIYDGPDTSEGLDRNGDGTVDEKLFFDGGLLSRDEADRDFDGRVDAITEYTRNGDASSYRTDDDFDGRLESTIRYRDRLVQQSEVDVDGDGQTDVRTVYERGVASRTEYLDRASRRIVKTVTFGGGKPVRVELDRDADGQVERAYDLDAIDEPVAN